MTMCIHSFIWSYIVQVHLLLKRMADAGLPGAASVFRAMVSHAASIPDLPRMDQLIEVCWLKSIGQYMFAGYCLISSIAGDEPYRRHSQFAYLH